MSRWARASSERRQGRRVLDALDRLPRHVVRPDVHVRVRLVERLSHARLERRCYSAPERPAPEHCDAERRSRAVLGRPQPRRRRWGVRGAQRHCPEPHAPCRVAQRPSLHVVGKRDGDLRAIAEGERRRPLPVPGHRFREPELERGASATAGIERADGVIARQVSFNQPQLTNGRAVSCTYGAPPPPPPPVDGLDHEPARRDGGRRTPRRWPQREARRLLVDSRLGRASCGAHAERLDRRGHRHAGERRYRVLHGEASRTRARRATRSAIDRGRASPAPPVTSRPRVCPEAPSAGVLGDTGRERRHDALRVVARLGHAARRARA